MIGRKKPIGFMDLSHGRFGTFKDMYPDGPNGTVTIEYREPNSIRNIKIHGIKHGSWIEVTESFLGDDRYGGRIILFNGEEGRAPMLKKYFGEEGIAADLINRMDTMRRDHAISRASLLAQKRHQARGAAGELKTVIENIKEVNEAAPRQQFMPPTGKPYRRY